MGRDLARGDRRRRRCSLTAGVVRGVLIFVRCIGRKPASPYGKNQSPLAEDLPGTLELVADLIGRRMIRAAVGAVADHVPGLGHSSDEELAKAITDLVRAVSVLGGTEAQARRLLGTLATAVDRETHVAVHRALDASLAIAFPPDGRGVSAAKPICGDAGPAPARRGLPDKGGCD